MAGSSSAWLTTSRIIARGFRELRLIEPWGSGIPSVFREAARLGLPPLEIQEVAMRLRFTVPLLAPIPLESRTDSKQQSKSSPITNPL
ncbi:MAG: hypothetical protein NTW21_35610 [Verrucomicrobia bacterium]|nr:hypothetical protein [Verrucomicrobiota bacterium]